jgi:hypothetical protein
MHTYNNKNQPKKAKTAFIRGFEKPWLFLKDEELIFRFSDIPLHGAGRIRSGDVDDIYTLEDFFWTPNYPLIPVKQSHVIKNVFMGVPKIYERFKQLSQSRPLNSYDQEAPNELDRVYARYIYSYSNQINFIAPKPKQNPELFLINKIENQENAKYFNQLIEEKKDYYLNRYRNVVNQNLLKRHWVTKGYFVFNMNNVIRK